MSINPSFIDERPSLSADGSRLVFISGRASSVGQPTMKVYKIQWSEGQQPGAASRVTTSDEFGTERDAQISPDGKLVLISALVGKDNNLFLASFDNSSEPRLITAEPEVSGKIISFAFSPDSRLIGWIVRNLDAGTSRLVISEISEEGVPGNVFQVKTGESFIYDFNWVRANSGYAVIVSSSRAGGGQLSYDLIRFSNSAESSMEPEIKVLVEAAIPVPNVQIHANAQRLMLARRVVPAGSRQAKQAGDFAADTPVMTEANSEPISLELAQDSAVFEINSFADLPGTDVLALGLAQDNSTAFFLQRSAWRCASDGIVRYGAALHQADPELTSFRRIVPRMGLANGTWEVALDYCDRTRADQSLGGIDDRIVFFRVNAAATAEKYRIAYVSRFSPARDKDCNYLLGDPEVLVLDVNGEKRSILPLSTNLAPLESQARAPNLPPCDA